MGSTLPIPAGATNAAPAAPGNAGPQPAPTGPSESMGPRLSISPNQSAQPQPQGQPVTAQGRIMPPAVPSTGAAPAPLNPSPVQAGKPF